MKNTTTSNILHFSAAVLISKILGAATTFCAASILLPADYGIWATLTLVISLSTIFLFGSVETLVKQVPYYQGQANEQMIGMVDGGVCASVFLSSGILLLLSLALCFPVRYRELFSSATWGTRSFRHNPVFLVILIGDFVGAHLQRGL